LKQTSQRTCQNSCRNSPYLAADIGVNALINRSFQSTKGFRQAAKEPAKIAYFKLIALALAIGITRHVGS
jgi:hypothetical protein